MAKGRRLTSSRSERLLGIGNYSNYYDHVHDHGHDHGQGYHENGNIPEVSEFREEDVWSMVDDTSGNYHHDNHGGHEWTSRATVENGRTRSSERVRFHHEERHVGGLSLAFDDKTAPSSRRILHQYGGATCTPRVVGPSGSTRHMATSAPVNVPDWSKILRVNSVESMQDSDEDTRVDSVMEPPHEYLARSRQKNAFSVFEGVGRTLKGRDLSRVRDAVWSQTGFEG